MNIFYVDVSELSFKDWSKFVNFWQRHKNQDIETLVETWNKYNNKLSQHVFLRKKANTENT